MSYARAWLQRLRRRVDGGVSSVGGDDADGGDGNVRRHSRLSTDSRGRYEASNPLTGQRGYVPRSYFQTLGRNARTTSVVSNSRQITSTDQPTATTEAGMSPQLMASPTMASEQQPRKAQGVRASTASPLYGVVMYDFEAERPDELDAKAGEAIIIIAQSNHEWFVAKPIGRLGGPGLIPVSFIEIRDMATGRAVTNLDEVVAKAAVPKVEEWKKAAAEYRNNSIPLGRFDFDDRESLTSPGTATADQLPAPATGGAPAMAARGPQRTSDDPLFVIKASVDQFFMDGPRHWFLLRCEMNDGRHRNLCRFYEDFYDFQIALLDAFPVEAGRTGEQRILPFMPGPLSYVDDTISAQRRADLDVYVQELCQLPAHITRHRLLHELFAAREGDVESSHATSLMPQPARSTSDRKSQQQAQPQQQGQRRSQPSAQQRASAGSQTQPSQQQQQSRGGYGSSPPVNGNGEVRMKSIQEQFDGLGLRDGRSAGAGAGAGLSNRTSAGGASGVGSAGAARSAQTGALYRAGSDQDARYATASSQTGAAGGAAGAGGYNPAARVPVFRGQPAATDGASAQSPALGAGRDNMSGAFGADGLSAGNPIAASAAAAGSGNAGGSGPVTQLKIKIFHDDDLIAIRVPSDIGYTRLREKIEDRIQPAAASTNGNGSTEGAGIGGTGGLTIRYRDPTTQQLKPVRDDVEHRQFMATGDKLVLYVQ